MRAIARVECVVDLNVEFGVVVGIADWGGPRLSLRRASVSAECAERDHEENTDWFDLGFHIGLTFLKAPVAKCQYGECRQRSHHPLRTVNIKSQETKVNSHRQPLAPYSVFRYGIGGCRTRDTPQISQSH